MSPSRRIAALVALASAIGGAAILWPVYKERVAEQKLAEAARIGADKGDAAAQFSLGNMYRKGQGVPRDDDEAVRWYHKAAAQGDAKAEYTLGVSYSRGQGVPQDDAEAVRWYRKAADQGDAMAQYGLGFIYVKAKGVPRDDAEATRWFRKAADQGDTKAQFSLGNVYYYGQGVPQDYAEAVRWYRKAAGQGDATAQYVVGLMYYRGQGVSQDYAEAIRWLRAAGFQGDKSAQGMLTILYFKGGGVPKDDLEALRWLGKIAASCFKATQDWTSIVAVLLALPILVVPQRRWGRVTWLPLVMTSACCAALLAHERSPSSFAMRVEGLVGAQYSVFVHVLWFALLGGASVIYAFAAVVAAKRALSRQEPGATSDSAAGTLTSS